MWTPPPFLDFPHDATRDVIARQQLRRTPRVLVALGITPAFFFIVGRLRFVVVGNEIEHKASAFLVREDSPVAAHTLGNENSGDTRRPHHSGGMKLHKLHVDQFRAGLIPK